jgi:hypothetical protein
MMITPPELTEALKTALACAQDLFAENEPLLFPPVLHMGKLIPSEFLECIGLNRVYAAARYDSEAARCFRHNGLPTPTPRRQKTNK